MLQTCSSAEVEKLEDVIIYSNNQRVSLELVSDCPLVRKETFGFAVMYWKVQKWCDIIVKSLYVLAG